MKFSDQVWLMQSALKEAELAYKAGEVPVGAVLVNDTGTIIAQAHNQKEKSKDASAHAEILVLQKAAQKEGDWRLTNHTLIVTLEPCPMCLSAISQFRLKHLIFGAYDPKGGALSLGYSLHKDTRLNHKFSVTGGLMHFECSQLLSYFFKERRGQYKTFN